MDTAFKIFMYVLPYALCIAAYIWVGKKVFQASNKITKAIAFIILAAGFCYTIYRMISTSSKAFAEDRFEFVIIIVTVFVLFFASIAITLGEPEEKIINTTKKD